MASYSQAGCLTTGKTEVRQQYRQSAYHPTKNYVPLFNGTQISAFVDGKLQVKNTENESAHRPCQLFWNLLTPLIREPESRKSPHKDFTPPRFEPTPHAPLTTRWKRLDCSNSPQQSPRADSSPTWVKATTRRYYRIARALIPAPQPADDLKPHDPEHQTGEDQPKTRRRARQPNLRSGEIRASPSARTQTIATNAPTRAPVDTATFGEGDRQ